MGSKSIENKRLYSPFIIGKACCKIIFSRAVLVCFVALFFVSVCGERGTSGAFFSFGRIIIIIIIIYWMSIIKEIVPLYYAANLLFLLSSERLDNNVIFILNLRTKNK